MRPEHRTAVALALGAALASHAGAAHAQRTVSDREINQVASTHFRLGMQHFRGARYADAARDEWATVSTALRVVGFRVKSDTPDPPVCENRHCIEPLYEYEL
jgi:hypothetical protein